MRAARSLAAGSALLILASACSSTSPSAVAAPDASADAPTAGSSTETKQTGRAAVIQANTPVAGAVVSVAGKQATTDADGNYAIVVPRQKPITLKVTAADHYQLIEQEYVVDKDTYARGDSLVLKNQTARLLAAFLPGFDNARGIVVVKVIPTAGCASEEGTTLTLEPAGAELRYTKGGLPDAAATALTAGENNGAIFYNVTPAVPVRVTATHPTCKQLPYPVEYQGVKYTGAQTTEPGESFSFLRVFLGPAQ